MGHQCQMFASDACKDIKIALVNWHDYARLRWVQCQHKGRRLGGAVAGELLSVFSWINKKVIPEVQCLLMVPGCWFSAELRGNLVTCIPCKACKFLGDLWSNVAEAQSGSFLDKILKCGHTHVILVRRPERCSVCFLNSSGFKACWMHNVCCLFCNLNMYITTLESRNVKCIVDI